MSMIKNKFGQAKCPECGSWHWAIELDDDHNVKEFKCCKCGHLETPVTYKRVENNINVNGAEDGKHKHE